MKSNTLYAYVWTLIAVVTVIVAFIVLDGTKHISDNDVKIVKIKLDKE